MKSLATTSRTLLAILGDRDNAHSKIWQREFQTAILESAYTPLAGQALRGPDGFVYKLCAPASTGESHSKSFKELSDECLGTGTGLVISANLEKPQSDPLWVFSFGDLWAQKYYSNFFSDGFREPLYDVKQKHVIRDGLNTETIQEERAIILGAPSEVFMPAEVRSVLEAFFTQVLHFYGVRIAALHDAHSHPSMALMFNFRLEDLGSSEQAELICHMIQWFLPRGRVFAFKPESLSSEAFVSLGLR